MNAMGDGGNEPSMEHILSSIKRIIAEDGEAQVAERRERRPQRLASTQPMTTEEAPAAHDEPDVLELSDAMTDTPAADEGGEAGLAPAETLISQDAAVASRTALDQLSRLVVKPEVTGSDTLEGMVREMLRPMLAEWLDENLPRVVDTMVAREISRITGR